MDFFSGGFVLLLCAVMATARVQVTRELCANSTLLEAALRSCYRDNDIDVRLGGNLSQESSYSAAADIFEQRMTDVCRDLPKLLKAIDCGQDIRMGCTSPAVDLYSPDPSGIRAGITWVCQNVQEGTFDCLDDVMTNHSCQVNLTSLPMDRSMHELLCSRVKSMHDCLSKRAGRCGERAQAVVSTYLGFQSIPACTYTPHFTAPTPDNCSVPSSVVAAMQQCYATQGLSLDIGNTTNHPQWLTYLYSSLQTFPSEQQCRNVRPLQDALACAGSVLRGCLPASRRYYAPDGFRLAAGVELLCQHWDKVNMPCMRETMEKVNFCAISLHMKEPLSCPDHYFRLCQATHMACCGPATAKLMIRMVDYHISDVCVSGLSFTPPRVDYLAHAVCPEWQHPSDSVRNCDNLNEVTRAVTKCYADRGLAIDLSDVTASGSWSDALLRTLITTTASRDCTDVGRAELALGCALSQAKWCYPPQRMAAFPNIGQLMEATRYFCSHRQTLDSACVKSKAAEIADCEKAEAAKSTSESDYCGSYSIKKTCTSKYVACCSSQSRVDHVAYLEFRKPPSCPSDVIDGSDVTTEVTDVCSGARGFVSANVWNVFALIWISVCVAMNCVA